MLNKNKISGGYADNVSAEDIAKKHNVSVKDIKSQIKKGTSVELEHVDDKNLSKDIALDHIFEIPDYYTRLDKMEKDAKKEMKDMKTENKKTTDFAKRMRELAGISEGENKKSIKTINEGDSSFGGGATFYAKDVLKKDDKKDDEFDTHQFEQKAIEECANDQELYSLNEDTIIVLDFLEDVENEENK